MFDLDDLERRLPVLGLGEPLVFRETVGSTNDIAAELARQGAPHGTLVLADEQTAGRGRAGRSWSTPPRSALALSLVLRPAGLEPAQARTLTVLGALAMAEALEGVGLAPRIKWPNDVLLDGRKVAGTLAEAGWEGAALRYIVLGIGVNVRPASVPADAQTAYPATCVETVAGRRMDRGDLLLAIVAAAGRWLPKVGLSEVVGAWDRRLAFRGEEVVAFDGADERRGRVLGLRPDGGLRLETPAGDKIELEVGEIRLRPVDTWTV